TDPRDDERFISSDANVWPFWTGVITDQKMMKKAFKSIQKYKLNQPFPLKYQVDYHRKFEHPINSFIFPNYNAGNSIMTLIGPLYIELLTRVEPQRAKRELKKMKSLIEQHGTYAEVFTPDGKQPLQGKFSIQSDTGMLWAAMIPKLKKVI